MRRGIVISLLAGLMIAPAARADIEKGAIAPDIEAKDWLNTDHPIRMAELRGMVVVLYFWVSFHAGGESLMPMINLIENNPEIGRQKGVYVMGVTEADRKRTESQIAKNKIFFPVALESKAENDYKLSQYPSAVVINTEGRVVWSGWPGDKGGDELVKAVQDALAETPPTRTHPREVEQCQKFMTKAREELGASRFRKAYAAAREANSHALAGDPLKTRCQDLLDLLDAIGVDRLAIAQRLIDEKQFDKGVQILNEVSQQFRGMDCSRRARKKLETLASKHEPVAKILEKQKRDRQALGLLAESLEEIRESRFGSAYLKLDRVSSEFGDTDAAADARDVQRRMDEFEVIRGAVRDYRARSECESLLSRARNYKRLGRNSDARVLLEQIVKQHPDTTFANEARRELIRLR